MEQKWDRIIKSQESPSTTWVESFLIDWVYIKIFYIGQCKFKRSYLSAYKELCGLWPIKLRSNYVAYDLSN